METHLTYPNFLIIGAGKSGTTSLYHYLSQHPQVFMPEVKEPDFFALEGQKPVAPEDDPEEIHNYPWAVFNLEDYKALFRAVTTQKAVGEASTMYLYKPDTHLRIKKYVPKAKLIAIFRDPVSRLYSRFLHLARENRLPSANFEDLFDKNSIWWRRDDLVREGFYYQHFKKYTETFPKKQLKVFLFEDLTKNTHQTIKELFNFLDIDNTFQPQTEIRYNESGFIKKKWVDYVIGQKSFIRKGVEKITPGLVANMRRSPGMQKWVTSMRSKNLHKPVLSPEIRKKVINEVYLEDIEKFQKLINRDLSKWLK